MTEIIRARSIEPVLHSFAYCLDFLNEQLAGIAEADMVAQPNGINNHPAWVIGHLVHTCQMLGEVIGIPPWLPEDWAQQYGTGSVPVANARQYESKSASLERLADARQRITRGVRQLADSQLDEPFPDESYRDVFPTVRHALTQVLVGHTANHIGQVTLWRRAMGLAPLGRSFE